jgi:hypothetical protein
VLLNDAKERRKSMPASSANLKTLGTCAVGLATISAAVFTYWQFGVAKDTEKQQLRAYISIVPVSENSKDIGRFNLKNFGSTPARHVRVDQTDQRLIEGVSEMHSMKQHADTLPVLPDTGKTVFQQDSIQWELGADSGLQATHASWDNSHNKILVTVGKINYDDVFHEHHETSFCVFEKYGDPTLYECPDGNDDK